MRRHSKMIGITLALALTLIGSTKAEAQYGNARNWYGNEWMYGNTGGWSDGGYWGGNNLTGPRYTPDRGDYIQVPSGVPGQSSYYYVPGSALQNRPGINAPLYNQGFNNFGFAGHEYFVGNQLMPPYLANCHSAAGGYWNFSPFTARFCAALASQSFIARFGYGLTPVTGFARWAPADFAAWGNRVVAAQYEAPPPIKVDNNGFDYSQMATWAQTVNNPPMPTLPVNMQPASATATNTPQVQAVTMPPDMPKITDKSTPAEIAAAFQWQTRAFEEFKAAVKRQAAITAKQQCRLDPNCEE